MAGWLVCWLAKDRLLSSVIFSYHNLKVALVRKPLSVLSQVSLTVAEGTEASIFLPSGPLQVKSAFYGHRSRSVGLDVTQKVQALIRDGYTLRASKPLLEHYGTVDFRSPPFGFPISRDEMALIIDAYSPCSVGWEPPIICDETKLLPPTAERPWHLCTAEVMVKTVHEVPIKAEFTGSVWQAELEKIGNYSANGWPVRWDGIWQVDSRLPLAYTPAPWNSSKASKPASHVHFAIQITKWDQPPQPFPFGQCERPEIEGWIKVPHRI